MCSEQGDGICSRMQWVGNLDDAVRDADLVIEAVVEIENVMGAFPPNNLSSVDLSLNIMKRQYAETGIKPADYDLYEDMVAQGRFGKKCGRAFYEYVD